MAFTIQDTIDRARIYLDDNHKATDGWKEPADWLDIIQPELRAIYRKWVRESLISFTPIDGIISAAAFTYTSPPLAILGVAQQSGNIFRLLPSAMAHYGRAPFWESGTPTTAAFWTASVDTFPTGSGEPQYSVNLHPPDTATGYKVRYINFPSMGNLSDFIILPPGHEDYVALRLSRKGLASEGASSQAIERLIINAEAEIKMEAFSNNLGGGPKVRIVRPFAKQRQFTTWPNNPMYWYYP